MTIFIIIIIVIGILYFFNSDRKDEKIQVLQVGGMKRIYPNFLQLIDGLSKKKQSIVEWEASNFECVKDDGEYLEFKFTYIEDEKIVGYYFIGIQHVFVSFAYCYCKNSKNQKIEGFMRELPKQSANNQSRDIDIEQYRWIFRGLINQMENSEKYDKKFYT